MADLPTLLAAVHQAAQTEAGEERVSITISMSLPLYQAWRDLDAFLRVHDPLEALGRRLPPQDEAKGNGGP